MVKKQVEHKVISGKMSLAFNGSRESRFVMDTRNVSLKTSKNVEFGPDVLDGIDLEKFNVWGEYEFKVFVQRK